jgi:hypothetical protein
MVLRLADSTTATVCTSRSVQAAGGGADAAGGVGGRRYRLHQRIAIPDKMSSMASYLKTRPEHCVAFQNGKNGTLLRGVAERRAAGHQLGHLHPHRQQRHRDTQPGSVLAINAAVAQPSSGKLNAQIKAGG